MPKQTLKRRADGRYACKYQGKFFYGSTQSEAFRARDEYKKTLATREALSSPKVAEYAAGWLPVHKSEVSDRYYNACAIIIDKMTDMLGDKCLDEVTSSDIKRVYAEKYSGMSESYIRKAKTLYTAIFDSASEDRLIMRNPCRAKTAQPHHGTEGTHRNITEEERSLIHTVPHRLRPAVMSMLYAGLRRGEALALNTSRDVDFLNNSITVRQAVSYTANQPILKGPKTEAGKRTIPLFPPLEPVLKPISGILAPAVHSGCEMSESAFDRAWESYVLAIECHLNGVSQKRWFGLTKEAQKADPDRYAKIMQLKAAGKETEADELRLEKWKSFTVRPHDLRHSFCVMLRDAGVDLKQAIEWMGHEDEKMILRIYDHVTEERRKKSVLLVEKMLSGSQNGSQKDD